MKKKWRKNSPISGLGICSPMDNFYCESQEGIFSTQHSQITNLIQLNLRSRLSNPANPKNTYGVTKTFQKLTLKS